MVWRNPANYQSTKYSGSSIQKQEGEFRGLEEPKLSWHKLQLTTEVHCLGQETNMESTAGKREEQGIQSLLYLQGHI